MGAQDPRHPAARAHAGGGEVGHEQHVRPGPEHGAAEEQSEQRDRAQVVLHPRGEGCQERDVGQQVQPADVHEHRRQQRHQPAAVLQLVRDRPPPADEPLNGVRAGGQRSRRLRQVRAVQRRRSLPQQQDVGEYRHGRYDQHGCGVWPAVERWR